MSCPSTLANPCDRRRQGKLGLRHRRRRGLSQPSTPGREVIDAVVARFRELLKQALDEENIPTDPGSLLAVEENLHRSVARECLDPVMGAIIQLALAHEKVWEGAAVLVAATPRLQLQRSSKLVSISLLGGGKASVGTPYYLARQPRKSKSRLKQGRRGREGTGRYPMLAVLGIHFRVTPALASEAARLYAQSTVKESTGHLEVRGISMECKKLYRLSKHLAKRALSYRDWLIRQGKTGTIRGTAAKGKRLAIGVDGGRLRTRVNRTGRRRKSGKHAFEAAWKEPKVLVIYEIDKQGRKVRNGLLRYDATMKNADAIFEILAALLLDIGAHEATDWTFVGDGAEWIWERIPNLVKAVGYESDKVTEVVDFYHASERIHAFAGDVDGRKGFVADTWVRRLGYLLKRGRIDDLLAEMLPLCIGRHAVKLRKQLDYFDNHRDRMDYHGFRERGVPMGSGSVESAVRRIVNLRLKGNSIYWDPDNAEDMLHLRSQFLAGHWREFVVRVLQPVEFWGAKAA